MEKKAGIETFAPFGYINTVNSLAGGDLDRWNIIMAMPYEKMLTKLLLNQVEAAYQKKYNDALRIQREQENKGFKGRRK